MKTTSTKVSLLALALFAIGCNEQVAPELKNSNSSTTAPPTTITPPEYFFRVVDKSPLILNYKVHRTGETRAETLCEVKKTVALSNDLYRGDAVLPHDQKTNDITCFFEAEELSLFHSGMSFAYEASPNTCEYVAYAPYSYYDRVPGTSTSSITQVECENATDADAATRGAPAYDPDGTGPTPATTAGCGQSVDTSIVSVTERRAFPNFGEVQDLCRFDYTKDGGPNCDEGMISLTILTVTVDDNGVVSSNSTTTRGSCGGKASNCIAGPIKLEPTIANMTNGSVVHRTELNGFFTKTVELPGVMDTATMRQNRDYVNFRRNLASTQIDFIDDFDLGYKAAYAAPAYNKAYDPNLLDMYSSNKRMDGTPIVSSAALTAQSKIHGYTARPLAIEAFMGASASYKTSPFYTFYCLDRAMDIKARIRMVVRDWDRVFPVSNNLELLSDINMGVNARQDVPDDVEIPGDQDSYNYFNDVADWDDFLQMSRTPGPYAPGTTQWLPYHGVFNPLNYPNGGFQ